MTTVPETSGIRTTPEGRSSALELLGPLARALLWGTAGFLLGAGLVALLSGGPLFGPLSLTIGYVLGLIGWLLGIGAWEGWVKPWFGGPTTWDQGTGAARYFRYNTDHKVVGLQYLVTAAGTFFLAGLLAMLMRAELLSPDLDFFATPEAYNTVVGIHGTLMIFGVAVVAIIGGFGNYFVPLMVGAEDMTFPQVNGLSYWFVPPGVAALLLSPLVGGFQTGWTGYAPLSAQDGNGQLLYFLGLIILGTSSLLTAINLTATIVYLRAPGMTLSRLPVFVWSMLATAVLSLLWLPVIVTDLVLGLTDRLVPTNFFSAEGSPLVWQDLFWLFGHPEVYVIILPAFGLWLEIVPVMARKSLFAYRWAVAGLVAVTVLSSVVWSHHMFTTVEAQRLIPFMLTTEIISIPTGLAFLSVLGTLWGGRIRLNTPMLLVLMSMFNFLIGGVTGIFNADVAGDFQLHDTYWVVSHFHYTILGGMVFAWFAGLYFWFPKFTGRMYNEFWGKVSAWWMLIGFNAAFFPMYLAGIAGMNRRVAIYLQYLSGLNAWISVAAFFLGIGFLIPLVNFVYSWARGPRAAANPWRGKTLEWQTSSPPPHENFARVPVLTWDMYAYGEGSAHPTPLFRTAGTEGD